MLCPTTSTDNGIIYFNITQALFYEHKEFTTPLNYLIGWRFLQCMKKLIM